MPVPDRTGVNAKVLYPDMAADTAVLMADMKRAGRFTQRQIKTDCQCGRENQQGMS